MLLSKLREMSYNGAVTDLASKVDPADFQKKFGDSMDSLQKLIETKTVTISALARVRPKCQRPCPLPITLAPALPSSTPHGHCACGHARSDPDLVQQCALQHERIAGLRFYLQRHDQVRAPPCFIHGNESLP